MSLENYIKSLTVARTVLEEFTNELCYDINSTGRRAFMKRKMNTL